MRDQNAANLRFKTAFNFNSYGIDPNPGKHVYPEQNKWLPNPTTYSMNFNYGRYTMAPFYLFENQSLLLNEILTIPEYVEGWMEIRAKAGKKLYLAEQMLPGYAVTKLADHPDILADKTATTIGGARFIGYTFTKDGCYMVDVRSKTRNRIGMFVRDVTADTIL